MDGRAAALVAAVRNCSGEASEEHCRIACVMRCVCGRAVEDLVFPGNRGLRLAQSIRSCRNAVSCVSYFSSRGSTWHSCMGERVEHKHTHPRVVVIFAGVFSLRVVAQHSGDLRLIVAPNT